MNLRFVYLAVMLLFAVACNRAEAEEPTVETVGCECDTTLLPGEHEATCPYNSDEKRELWWRRATSDVFKPNEKGQFVPDTNFDGWSSLPATIISIITILASMVTILGFSELLRNIYKGRVSRRCQKLIIVDLVRHFAINLTILEGVKLRMAENKRPEAGTFRRFATLDSDVDLGSFSITAANYEAIHELSLFMRNFNLMVDVVEEHFAMATSIKGNQLLVDDIANIDSRMRKIIKRLWLMQVSLGYGIMEERVAHHFIKQYGGYPKVDFTKHPTLLNVEIPMFWSEEDIKEFKDANRVNHIFTRNIFKTISKLLSLAIYGILALGEYLFMGFSRITFYEYGSRVRKPRGWRKSAVKEQFADVYRRCIVKRSEDINYH